MISRKKAATSIGVGSAMGGITLVTEWALVEVLPPMVDVPWGWPNGGSLPIALGMGIAFGLAVHVFTRFPQRFVILSAICSYALIGIAKTAWAAINVPEDLRGLLCPLMIGVVTFMHAVHVLAFSIGSVVGYVALGKRSLRPRTGRERTTPSMQGETKTPDRSVPLALNGPEGKRMTKLRLVLLLGAVTACVCVAVVLWSWWQSPKRRVHRLVREVLNRPAGFSLDPGMSQDAIDEEYKRLGARAIPPLIDLLQHEDSGFRRVAAGELGERGDARAVVPLIRLLSDPNDIVRSFAARALGSLGDRRASTPLLNMLMHDTDAGVRGVAAGSLGLAGDPKDPKVVSALIESLETGGLRVRAYAARSLGLLKDHAAVPALEKALDDHEPGVRREAALALVRLGVNLGIDELLVALGKDSVAGAVNKVTIIQALADVADQRVKAALDRIASSDQSPAVRDAARRALMPR